MPAMNNGYATNDDGKPMLVEPAPGWPGPWYPVVTFWQVTGDVIAALDPPAGHGHRYGPDSIEIHDYFLRLDAQLGKNGPQHD